MDKNTRVIATGHHDTASQLGGVLLPLSLACLQMSRHEEDEDVGR